jgi:hypothetical protein
MRVRLRYRRSSAVKARGLATIERVADPNLCLSQGAGLKMMNISCRLIHVMGTNWSQGVLFNFKELQRPCASRSVKGPWGRRPLHKVVSNDERFGRGTIPSINEMGVDPCVTICLCTSSARPRES